MVKKKYKPIEIDYSKLRRSSAKTTVPVYFAISEDELAERMARQWEKNEKLIEERRLREKCLLQEEK